MVLAMNSWLEAFGGIGMWSCIAIMFISFAAIDISKRAMRHRERMAMIQAGLDPDAAKRKDDEE